MQGPTELALEPPVLCCDACALMWLFGDPSFLPIGLLLGALVHISPPAIGTATLHQSHGCPNLHLPPLHGAGYGAGEDWDWSSQGPQIVCIFVLLKLWVLGFAACPGSEASFHLFQCVPVQTP